MYINAYLLSHRAYCQTFRINICEFVCMKKRSEGEGRQAFLLCCLPVSRPRCLPGGSPCLGGYSRRARRPAVFSRSCTTVMSITLA